jgi:predicted Rossmann-fold nucleotide-binding protein
VRGADALVVIGGEWGTLSEVALALQAGKTVAGMGRWAAELDAVVLARSGADAAAVAFEAALSRR